MLNQINPKLKSKPELLVILGKRGSGKSTIASILEIRNSYKHYEMSLFLKKEREKDNMNHLRLRKYVSFLHQSKSKYCAVQKLFANKVSLNKNTVLTGIRNPLEIKYLTNNLTSFNINIIYLKATFLTRFLRVRKRKSRSNFFEFLIEEYYSIVWGNKKLKSKSNYMIQSKNEADETYNIMCKHLQISTKKQ